jgi:WD repeat-containing protein 23
LPQRRPRDFGDDASKFISNALHTPLSFLKGSHRKATPEDVQGSGIELDEDEVLEEERGEEAEVDDSPDPIRRIRVMTMTEERYAMVEKAKNRRRWEVTPLRKTNARRL